MEFTTWCHYYDNCQFYFRNVTVSAWLRASRGEREETGALDLLDHTHTAVIQSSLHQLPTPSQYEALQFKGNCHELKVEKTVAAFSTVKISVRPSQGLGWKVNGSQPGAGKRCLGSRGRCQDTMSWQLIQGWMPLQKNNNFIVPVKFWHVGLLMSSSSDCIYKINTNLPWSKCVFLKVYAIKSNKFNEATILIHNY